MRNKKDTETLADNYGIISENQDLIDLQKSRIE